ncbi:tetratricopeptide repeat protein [Lacunisphaera limnophila]|uniref:Tetratricopeptide repeat protein n=1 Tax=Lacunisphaera limnophila TaxID=1838286 RepID=A0A1D8ARR3_9BACT|nr:tetratricopeptide repeat protein [Lacunisphaera limnophila]AOS43566.1 tetratricopeptide repeat protein [Lacunisphaera limnophila]
MRRGPRFLLLALVALLGLAAWLGYGLWHRHRIVAQHLPATPTLAGAPATLSDQIGDATLQARHWRHAPRGLAQLSRLYHANGFYPEALQCYQGLSALEPRNARWPHLTASIITNYGRMDEALPLRRQAVALAPDYLPAHLRLGDVLLKGNQATEASAAYAEALRRAPGNPFALLGLARCDLAAGDWSRARTRLQEAVARNPDFIGALSLLVTVSEHFGDRATADALRLTIGRREFSDLPDPWVDELTEVCFDAYRLSVAAAVANAAGDRATALALLERAIILAPQASTYHRQAGQLRLDENNFAAARDHLEKAVALNPTDSDAWLRLMDAYRGMGQTQPAVRAMLTGLTHCPQSPSLHLEHARWLRANNRLDEAIAEFRVSHLLRPSEASTLVELATSYVTAGRTAEAVVTLNQALERQPDHPIALATLALLAVNSRDEPEALRLWALIRLQPKTPPAVVSRLQQTFSAQFGRPLP